MTKTEYAEYLQGDHWKIFRAGHLDVVRACERCNMPRWLAEIVYGQDLHLHHKTYRSLGREKHGDVEVLCRRCHDIETFGRSELKAPQTATCSLCRLKHLDRRSDICAACRAVVDGHLQTVAEVVDESVLDQVITQVIQGVRDYPEMTFVNASTLLIGLIEKIRERHALYLSSWKDKG